MLKKILVVDDEPVNLQLMRQALKGKYDLLFANNGESAIEAALEHKPDMILLDIMMPGISGYEVCERLKAMPEVQSIPVIFVSAMSEIDNEAQGFDVGAVDYVMKPISVPILLRRVQTHLSLVRAQMLEQSQRETILMLGEAGHYNDTDTGLHIWRMAAYARALAELAGWSDYQAEMLEYAAPMHDTGKVGIPDNILKAPRKLTDEEMEVIKMHPRIGYEILNKGTSPLMKMAAEVAFYHHEKWDGSGYPNQLSGTDIPESARIVSIADVFDALTMKRPYKKAWEISDAIQEIKDNSGTHFEPRLVELLDQNLGRFQDIKALWEAREQK